MRFTSDIMMVVVLTGQLQISVPQQSQTTGDWQVWNAIEWDTQNLIHSSIMWWISSKHLLLLSLLLCLSVRLVFYSRRLPLNFSSVHEHKTGSNVPWISSEWEAARLLYSLQMDCDKRAVCVECLKRSPRSEVSVNHLKSLRKTLGLRGARRILSCITGGLCVDLVARWEREAAPSPLPQF